MVANPKREPYEEAISEFEQAAKGLRRLARASLEACPRMAKILTEMHETEPMAEKLQINLDEYITLECQVGGERNQDLSLKLSASPISELVALVSALNDPHNWPVGREVLIRLDQGKEYVPAKIVEYSNHFDWQEAAYPIYCRLTLRIFQ